MTKNIHQFTTNRNGEDLHVNILETEQGFKIEINGKELQVSVNGDVFYDSLEKEEYTHIPPSIRPFLSEQSFDYFSLDNGVPNFTLIIQGVEYACSITKLENKQFLELRNWTLDAEKMDERLDLENDIRTLVKKEFDTLKNHIESIGYGFRYSHDGDEFDNVYFLSVPISEFDKDFVLTSIRNWIEYNRKLKKYIED